MAYILAKAEAWVVDTGVWVHHLVRKRAALVGLVVKAGVALSIAFIRLVFLKLHPRVTDRVRQLSRIL